MKKTLATIGAVVVLVAGGIAIEDVATANLVATLNAPITMGEAIKFRAPSHKIEINDNGFIEIVIGDNNKRYGLMPSKAAEKDKKLFLDIESSDQEAKIKEVYGTGSELVIKNTSRSFSKVVSITEAFLKDVPEDAKYVEVSFDLLGWNVPDGTYNSRIELQKDVWLEKALAWDSSQGDPDNDIANGNYTDVSITIEKGVLTKRIPVAWLKTAVFPIYTDAVFTFGTKELLNGTGNAGDVVVAKIGTDKAVACWVDASDASAEGRCQIQTVSGTDITFGSPSDYTADAVGANNGAAGMCEAGNDRWVVVFADDADADDGTARVASSTGTTINGYGTALDFDDGVATGFPTCTYISTDKVVIAWRDGTNTSAQAAACTIGTDDTLTCGATVTLRDTDNTFFDISCATLDTDKFICHYRETDSIFSSRLMVGTISGTTITLGTEQGAWGIVGDTGNDFGGTIIAPGTGQFTVLHLSGSSPFPHYLALGTVSGTTITIGATTTAIIATSTSFGKLVGIDSDSAFFYFQQGATDAGTTFLAAIPIELNFGSLTFSTSSAETVDTTTDPGSIHAAKIGDCKFAFVWEDDNNTNDIFAIIGDIFNCTATPRIIINAKTLINAKTIIP